MLMKIFSEREDRKPVLLTLYEGRKPGKEPTPSVGYVGGANDGDNIRRSRH